MAITFNVVYAGELIINSSQPDPAPKKSWNEVIKLFKIEALDINVKVNSYDHEGYKESIRNWLVTSPPDIIFWLAGNRMKFFVDRGLFEDISDVWKKENIYENFASTLPAMSVNNKKYGIPVSFYQWGIYYNKDLFKKYKLKVPETFDQLLDTAAVLKSNKITPFTLGTRFLWSADGWFDYLNLRINGYDFHVDLMEGKVSYTDARVKKVFTTWKRLVDNKYYIDNHASYSWIEAIPSLLKGEAAMYLMGNFLTASLPKDHNIGFFKFPIIDKKIPLAEDALIDSIHILFRTKNKKAEISEDVFIKQGKKLLSKVKTVQFYDRDTQLAI